MLRSHLCAEPYTIEVGASVRSCLGATHHDDFLQNRIKQDPSPPFVVCHQSQGHARILLHIQASHFDQLVAFAAAFILLEVILSKHEKICQENDLRTTRIFTCTSSAVSFRSKNPLRVVGTRFQLNKHFEMQIPVSPLDNCHILSVFLC